MQIDDNEFGSVVRVGRDDQLFEFCQALRRGLQDHEDFRTALDFSLPAVMRFHVRDKIGAGDEPGIQGGARKPAGDFKVGRGDERHAEIGGFHGD